MKAHKKGFICLQYKGLFERIYNEKSPYLS